ncbi:hypothetical protein CRG98_005638 [Punica granatum]|uniref:G-patch domain-containing protein n=1 Tax=Punica granatum TaxID=22663 RepID=A0A2I0KZU6_PUNGR|nr:hypothetical protein CRG98_005638 [Punica granatum]
MEETIRALQASETRPHASYGDCGLFPGMRLPSKFKIPEFKTYEGTTDPRHHLRHYRGKMLQYWGYEEFVIHSFQDSLTGSVLDWFMSLKAEDIPTWADLSRKFIDQYQYCAEAPSTLLELSTKEMARGQRFKEYATKWRAQAAKHIPPISEAQQIQGIYYSHLLAHTSSFSDLIEARKKLDLGIKLGRMKGPTASTPIGLLLDSTDSAANGLTTVRPPLRTRADSAQATGVESPSTGAAEPYFARFDRYPRARTLTPSVQDQSKRCDYHQGAPGHTLDNCWRLRDEIHKRIDSNRLTFNVVRPPNVQDNPLPDHRPSSGPSINMITICTSGRDEDAQDNLLPFVIDYTPEEPTVGFAGHMASPAPFVVDIPTREPYSDNKAPAIEVGAMPKSTPFPSKKVTEEEAEAFMKIIKASEYKVVEQMAKSSAHISLLALLLGSEPHREALLRVLDIPNAFSLLLGRPWIHSAGAIPSSLHQRLKFIVEEKLITTAVPYNSVGDGENLPFHSFETISVIRDYGEIGPSRADRLIGKVLLRNNYILGTGLGARGQGISRPIEIEEYKHMKGLGFRPSCHEIVEARRGNHLHRLAAYYGRLNRGIPENEDLDNWTSVPCYSVVTADMLHSNPNPRHFDSNPFEEHLGEPQPVYFGEGLPEDIEHFLPLNTEKFPPKRQQLQRQQASLLLRIKEEVVKQINARFLEVCNYFEWVANIVPVEKKDGRVRVCVDYRDLNKASPKDNFPLPHIDVLVDNTPRHALFSFMDDFSGYNQIRMAEKDKLKTTFTTMWGTFCYCVMPFGLKNGGATYQRAMVTLFHDMMHKEVEVYAKCTFGARSGKLLGFVVSERGIEVDPDKVKAIKELPPPSTVREVRGFLGHSNYIARFIANLTDKCQPLFRLLRKNAAMEWDHECQDAFDTIKAYLIQPSVLVPPIPNRPLILYLTVCRQSLGCMMIGQEDESTRTERAIYYLNKKFTEGESNYPEIEKMCCALVWVMQRLRRYTLYHTISLLSKADPLRYLLDSPSSMRNIAKWRCQLTTYDIEYVPRTSVKGQAIADHLAKFPINDDTPINTDFPDEGILQIDEEEDEPTWKMYFDGAVNSVGSGVGAVLISPDGRHYPIAAKVDFSCTNNVAEYEACILGLQAAIDFKVKELETKDAKLVLYHEYLEELAKNFEKISFTYTPCAKNQFADALTTLASMASISEGNIIEPLEIEVAKGPAHCNSIEASEAKPWYEDIKNFLRTGQYPPFADRRDRKTLRRLAIHYFLSGEILYRHSFDSTLLRCIDEHESRRLMEEVHGGNCGPHMNGLMLTKKIMRLGYY